MAEVTIKVEVKFFDKLLEVISQGVGKLYKPIGIRNEAEADAYRILLLKKAETQAALESRESELNFEDRMRQRQLFQETEKQKNLESVARKAAEQVESTSLVSNEPVDKDWITRFFSIIENVSNEEMQNLWAKILAGEIKSPNSFSLRTIEVLRNLSKHEAEIFTKVAKYAIIANQWVIIPATVGGNALNMQDYEIDLSDMLILEDAGIISSSSEFTVQLPGTDEKPRTDVLFYGKYALMLNKKAHCSVQSILVYYFTTAGAQLLSLIQSANDEEYLQKFAKENKHVGTEMSYGIIESREPGSAVRKIVKIEM